jgi:TPR repeat protein
MMDTARPASRAGSGEACLEQARILALGQGTKQNLKEAKRLLGRACKANYKPACIPVGDEEQLKFLLHKPKQLPPQKKVKRQRSRIKLIVVKKPDAGPVLKH